MFEIRHNGHFVHRLEDETEAKDWATKVMKGLDGVEVVPGGALELHCPKGFLSSHDSEEEAHAAKAKHQGRHSHFAVVPAGQAPSFEEQEPEAPPEVSLDVALDDPFEPSASPSEAPSAPPEVPTSPETPDALKEGA